MLKKRRFIAVLSSTALALSLAACQSSTDSSGSKTEKEKKEDGDKVVTITYARGADTTGSTEKLIKAFEDSHPNIKVEYQEMPNSSGQQHDQYVTAFSSKSDEIDVFDADVVWPAEFAQANYALELDRLIDKDGINMDDYFPATVQAGKFGGKQWAMPKYMDAGLLYYRTDVVKSPPKTWDELIAAAKDGQSKEGTKFGFALQANQYEGLVVNAIEFIASYGGQVIDENNKVVIDSPESVKGLSKMVEVVNSGITPNNILTFTEPETETAFIEGQTVLARNWPYMSKSAADKERSKVLDKVGYSVLPAGDKGSASTLGGYMTMINRYTDEPEAAWEFVKWMTGKEGQMISATEGGRAPTLKALYDDEKVKQAAPLFGNEEFVKVLHSAVPRPVTPNYPKISDIMQIEISKALTKKITPEEAVKNMQKKMEEALQ
ncbi:ABC transporter substrate-binding protein [Bacillus sp. B-jedd]|uniref:ABC transporter substrate-binding protein n=1 Tax=Bacillus sp. B-jedd TaxID=1476857 RepID=UPI0005156FA9|nr:ABC transporter substrate-binding protein [Bacillus sp. B-jedd]CEG27405.1 family 1 extracellular solute-binding protein [Bacillus sp. B-jedd]